MNDSSITKDKNINAALQKLVQIKQFKIDSLLEVTEAINNNYSIRELFKIYEFVLRSQMVGRLLIFHNDGEEWKTACQYGLRKNQKMTIDVTKDLLPYTDIQYPKSLLTNNKLLQKFDILIPVHHKEVSLAYVLLGDLELTKEESIDEKVKFIQTITNFIIVAIENKRLFRRQLEQESFKKELEVAEQVQTMLIPKQLPNNKQINMKGIYMPHHSISGDYYDYIPLTDDGQEFLICMADVSGKGIAAALLMANFQAVLRALAKETADLKELVKKLNARLLEITHGDKFITLFIAKHDLKKRQFSYINAGHNPPVLSHNNQIKLLDRGCTILGAFDELPFIHQTDLDLAPNSLILTYTDGLTDLENEAGVYFETDRLHDFLTENRNLAVPLFNEKLLQTLKKFKGDQAYTDDISILTYRIF